MAKKLHREYVTALDDDKKNPVRNQDPNKVKLWDQLNKVLRMYRQNPNKSASDLYSYLDVEYGGESQEKLLFGQSDMSLEDYMAVKVGDPKHDFVEFGKMVVSYRAQTELAARRLVGFMKFGSDVVSDTEVQTPSESKIHSPVKSNNEFIGHLSSKPYVEQVEHLATLTARLGETNVGKRFLADQFELRDWNNAKDTSSVVFDPYLLFYPPEVDEKPSAWNTGTAPSGATLGIGIVKSGSSQRGTDGRFSGAPERGDLFSGKGQLKSPGGSGFTSQLKSLRTNLPRLFANILPGVKFLDTQSGSGDAIYSPPYPKGGNDVPAENVKRWWALSWAKFFEHDTGGKVPEIDNHTSDLSTIAKAKPTPITNVPAPATVTKQVLGAGADVLGELTAVKGTDFVHLLNLNLAVAGISSQIYNDSSLDYSDYADLLADVTSVMGSLKVVEDIADDFADVATPIEDGGSTFAKAIDVAGKVGPFLDAYYLFDDAEQVATEMGQNDTDAAVGMSLQVAGGATMIAADFAAGGSAAAALAASNPAGWVFLAGAVVSIAGVGIYHYCNDTEMQNYFGNTSFGSYWDTSADAHFNNPENQQFRYYVDEEPNYARQISELVTLSRPLIASEPTLTYDDSKGATQLDLGISPIDTYSSTLGSLWSSTSKQVERKLMADNVPMDATMFVRSIPWDSPGDAEFRPLLHQFKLDEKAEIQGGRTVVTRNSATVDSEVPIQYADSTKFEPYARPRVANAKTWLSADDPTDLRYTADGSFAAKPGDGNGKDIVVKKFDATVKPAPNDQSHALVGGVPRRILKEKLKNSGTSESAGHEYYYLEFVAMPEGMLKHFDEDDLVSESGDSNPHDRLEDVPFVSREQKEVNIDFGSL
jgi:hypothetical protein